MSWVDTTEKCDPAKMFREAFTLMKIFAKQKSPGPQGDQGPQGDAGKISDTTDAAVCTEFANQAAGLTQAFWSVMCGPPSLNPFARFVRTPDDGWSQLRVVSAGDSYPEVELVELLKGHIQCETLVVSVVRQTLPVLTIPTDPDRGYNHPVAVYVARTVFKVADGRHFLITSVEASQPDGPWVLFVSDTHELQSCAMRQDPYSFERYLLTDDAACALITALGKLHGGDGVKAALVTNSYVPPSALLADMVTSLIPKTLLPNNQFKVIGLLQGDPLLYALVVPYTEDIAGEHAGAAGEHAGAAVLEIHGDFTASMANVEFQDGKATIAGDQLTIDGVMMRGVWVSKRAFAARRRDTVTLSTRRLPTSPSWILVYFYDTHVCRVRDYRAPNDYDPSNEPAQSIENWVSEYGAQSDWGGYLPGDTATVTFRTPVGDPRTKIPEVGKLGPPK
jgi:hypothetical protein